MTNSIQNCYTSKPLFPLGRVFITDHATKTIKPEDIDEALARHERADWGDTPEDFRAENDVALRDGLSIRSLFHDSNGVEFGIETDEDRTLTTVMTDDDTDLFGW